jgi:uncharacterized protein
MDQDAGLCRGCYRTIEEIARWSTMTNAEQRAVLREVGRRKADPKGFIPRKG